MFGHFQRRAKHAANRRLNTLHALADFVSRRRPVWMVSFAMDETNLSEGLRAACAATSMLLLGYLLHDPLFAWASIGAFWTCLADAAGSNRMRFASMVSFALLSTLCGGLTALVSGAGTLAATAAILLFATAGALARVWGSAASQVGILAATACVVMVDKPMHSLTEGLPFLAIYLSGCLFAVVLSLTVWRIHPFGPSRDALRAVYGRLADIALDSARLLRRDTADFGQWARHAATYRGQARAALETARKALAKVPNSRAGQRETYEYLVLALADTERLFAYLIAVTDACERGHHTLHEPRRAARLLSALAEVMLRIGRVVSEPNDKPVVEDRWTALAALQRRLQKLAGSLEAALGEPLALRLRAAGGLAFEPTPRREAGWLRAAADNLARASVTLKANASLQSIGLRHAARVGVAVTAGFMIVRALHLPFGYWATMAILLILQPSIAATWPRSIERAAGSIAGGLLAAAIGFAVHSPIAISLIVFPLVCATMALRPVSYSLFVLFLTPTFVLVADFATPGASELIFALARLGNNVLGCSIALLATFVLWPSREPIDFRMRLADAVQANFDYLVGALEHAGGEDIEVERLRRAAGLASNNAEEAFNRLRLEKLESSLADRAAVTALALLRRVAGTATRMRFAANQARADNALIEWIAAVSREIDAHLRGTPHDANYVALPRRHLSLAEADAVNQTAQLRRLLVKEPGGVGEGVAQAATT
ncbi:FUSC family protein [Paraburkholderia sp. BCC1885]|uniref:FUSC family protein n=1 Tax=Paraburkholderia sp. BCC1885 TaxID=2562669 RepID=UPI0011823FCA|nr:FUSC family protein [Paraburkholderia sp. BCC1885]